MPYTPYTLQSILLPSTFDNSTELQQKSLSPRLVNNSFFSTKRPVSPTNNETLNTLIDIESVAAWDSDLYCGTHDGLILHYSLEDNKSSQDKTLATQLESTINLGLGKKPVEKILLIPQVSKAVILCDSTLSFFSLPFFDPIPTSLIQSIKGVTCCSHDISEEGKIGEDGTVELCVVKRRTIQIYKMGGESMYLKKELPLSDGAITLTRHSHMLCLADTQMYKLINLRQSTVIPLIPTPPFSPLIVVIRKNEFLMVGEGTIGIFVNASGDAIRGTLQWSDYPQHISVDYPYTTALLGNNTIEIHNIIDQKLVQTICLDKTLKGIAPCHGIKVWISDLSERLKLHPGSKHEGESYISTGSAHTLMFSKDGVWAQIATPLAIQVDALLKENLVEEAIHLADERAHSKHITERTRTEINYVYQKCGLMLLKETLFEDAFMLMSKGKIDPRAVVQMFEGLAQPRWINESPPMSVFEGVWQFIQELGTIKEVVKNRLEANGEKNNMQRTLLMNAREALERYLKIERDKRPFVQDDIICTVIDTSLLKIYMSQKNDIAIHQLLEQKNNCSIEDCAKALSKAKKFSALSKLYQSKHMHEKVLEIWTKIYSGELLQNDKEFDDKDELLRRIKDLLLQEDIRDEELPLSVVIRYAWWLTDQSPHDGVQVFIKSPRRYEMDSDEILEKLETYDEDIQKTYLEYLVLTENSKKSEYHTYLACSYVKDIQRILKDSKCLEEMKNTLEEFKRQVESTQKSANHFTFVDYLESQQSNFRFIKPRLLLIQLLEISQLYSPEILLNVLTEAGPLNIEKAVVYGRMNKHKEALDILIHELHDFVGAETYCVTNGKSLTLNKEKFEEEYLSTKQLNERRALFTMLFKSYIAINNSDLMITRSMYLLNTQGFYLDILKVLEIIPEDWPIHMLQDFLIRSLRRTLDDYNESQIVLALSRGENLLVNSEIIQLQKKIGPVVVENDTTCVKCHRDIGDKMFVRESEYGQLLHLHCAKLLGLVE